MKGNDDATFIQKKREKNHSLSFIAYFIEAFVHMQLSFMSIFTFMPVTMAQQSVLVAVVVVAQVNRQTESTYT